MFFKECDQYSLSTPSRIFIQSLLLAFEKAGIVSEEQFKDVDKRWKKYRKARIIKYKYSS